MRKNKIIRKHLRKEGIAIQLARRGEERDKIEDAVSTQHRRPVTFRLFRKLSELTLFSAEVIKIKFVSFVNFALYVVSIAVFIRIETRFRVSSIAMCHFLLNSWTEHLAVSF
jgi:hypothetical protein